LLSTFIRRVYAEIESKNQQLTAQQLNPTSKVEQEDNDPSSSSKKDSVRKQVPAKKAMSTAEAIAELKLLCKQEDPCSIYTDMIKIGEGYDALNRRITPFQILILLLFYL
jgi:hypothetical protein